MADSFNICAQHEIYVQIEILHTPTHDMPELNWAFCPMLIGVSHQPLSLSFPLAGKERRRVICKRPFPPFIYRSTPAGMHGWLSGALGMGI